MVRLINEKNVNKIAELISTFFKVQQKVTRIYKSNCPTVKSAIYALWHADQFALLGVEDKKQLNIMISSSMDGEIITQAIINTFGYKVVRGSSNRKGCVSAMLNLIERIKNGESAAITVDGPKGPLHRVKGGIVRLAKKTGAPIIPIHWYSPQKTFLHLPSWDKMTTPLFWCDVLIRFGDPIYISEDDSNSEATEKIYTALMNNMELAREDYKIAKKANAWK